MKLSQLLEPMFEILDVRSGTIPKYPVKNFNYEEWKKLSATIDVGDAKKAKDKRIADRIAGKRL